MSLSQSDMLESFYNMFRKLRACLGADTLEWGDLDSPEMMGWNSAFRKGLEVIENAEDSQWPDLGAEIYVGYAQGRGYGGTWDEQPNHMKFMWTCLARHLCNLMLYDVDEDGAVIIHEDRMADRYEQELKKLEASLS